jgi:hypothetical protein
VARGVRAKASARRLTSARSIVHLVEQACGVGEVDACAEAAPVEAFST